MQQAFADVPCRSWERSVHWVLWWEHARRSMDLRAVQKPLKEKYRGEPGSSRITLEARASQEDTPISCSLDIGRAVYEAQAHAGVGGAGTAACSGGPLPGGRAAGAPGAR